LTTEFSALGRSGSGGGPPVDEDDENDDEDAVLFIEGGREVFCGAPETPGTDIEDERPDGDNISTSDAAKGCFERLLSWKTHHSRQIQLSPTALEVTAKS
jgi:hypothetical protein